MEYVNITCDYLSTLHLLLDLFFQANARKFNTKLLFIYRKKKQNLLFANKIYFLLISKDYEIFAANHNIANVLLKKPLISEMSHVLLL